MGRVFTKLFIFVALLAILLTACGLSGDGPEDVYWDYWNSCEEQDLNHAKTLLSEGAIEAASTIGICGFTHDVFHRVEQASEGLEDLPAISTQKPEVEILDETAFLSWVENQDSYIPIVFMVNTDGEWKIQEVRWLK